MSENTNSEYEATTDGSTETKKFAKVGPTIAGSIGASLSGLAATASLVTLALVLRATSKK